MVQSASLHSLAHELVPGLEGPTLEVVSNSVFLLAQSWASPKIGAADCAYCLWWFGVFTPGHLTINIQKATDYLQYHLALRQVDKTTSLTPLDMKHIL